jgi:hypothetical protein
MPGSYLKAHVEQMFDAVEGLGVLEFWQSFFVLPWSRKTQSFEPSTDACTIGSKIEGELQSFFVFFSPGFIDPAKPSQN